MRVTVKDGSREPYLLLNRETGYYYVRKYKAGRGELFESTKEKTLGLARTARDEMIARFEGKERITKLRRAKVVALCALALNQCRHDFKNGDRRKRTVEHDRTYFPIIRDLFGDYYGDEIDEQFWDDWVRSKGKKLGRTLGDIAKYLSMALRIGHERKLIGRKPKIKNPDKAAGAERIYTDREIQVMLRHAEPMLKDLMAVGITTGMRPHENRELRWDWLTFRRDGVVIVTLPETFTKIGRARSFQASPDAAEVFHRLRKGAKGDHVFPSPRRPSAAVSDVFLSRMWRRMLVLARKDGFKGEAYFHWLRHSYYTKALLDARVDVQVVSEYGGTSIATLQKRYLKGDPRRTAAASTAVKLTRKDEEE